MQIILAVSEINIIKGIFMKTIETMQSYHLLKLLFSNSEVSYVLEEWNQQYEAGRNKTRNGHFKSRLAQKTPNKRLLFRNVEKDENHTNIPFTEDDLENQLIVNIVDDNRRGQFIFPKDILIKKGILKVMILKGKWH